MRGISKDKKEGRSGRGEVGREGEKIREDKREDKLE